MPPLRPLLSICLLPVATCLGAAQYSQDSFQDEREQFSLLSAKASAQALSTKQLASLHHYPLYPYLEYRRIRGSLDTVSATEVETFLDTYTDTPLYGRLLFAWAKQEGSAARWNHFLPAWNSIQRPDTELRCLHARYLLDSGQQAAAWEEARALWRVGYSQPDSCDPLFNPWLKSDNFQSADAFDRFLAALENGRPGLAGYVKDFIQDESYSDTVKVALDVYRSPKRLWQEPELLAPALDGSDRILEFGIRRLARQDLTLAIKLWLRDRDTFSVEDTSAEALNEYLGVWLAKRFPEQDERDLLRQLDPSHQLARLTEWRIRLLLTDLNWQEAYEMIGQLPEDELNTDRWRYWRAVAASHLSVPSQTDVLEKLSQERSFYGFMAAQLLGVPYQLNDTPHSPSTDALDAIASTAAFARIRELLHLERYGDARSEWNLAIKGFTPDQIMTAAHLMQAWGWHHQGIRGAISSQRWDDMALRFPNPYPELFKRHASSQDIDPYWALAVTRQESAFWMGARSRVGARGLMQLMPATAKATARRHGIPLTSTRKLSEPSLNIRLGTAYLGEMALRFNQNQAHASAAYNAGPHRVSQWLEARGELPLDIWIETIPFDETRQYVQNVLAFRVIYRTRDQQRVALFSQQEFSQLALNR
ncbi:transglycosylase SLT domain-containing protein [Marinobacterium sp. AK62]|uniref:Transglycosylase SLT domain-containing protein n=1 Tax=Marinobacterium alkalitolerans TaxID=1542925 RepID=A0ABS3ZBB4_9GAMM|nr:transglycosylase SLT domain-containing protein [Marinobacterium alkalitolerans]MBP0048997.1 transglycosylase SLT domain-containing protein [Marinobacterium alkalitolerans]